MGGSNSDTLIDGDSTGAADADALNGRGDADTVSYATRTASVRVDLADPAPDGERGENDVLRSVERVRGGAAGDWIGGTSGFNSLDGLGGDDRIFGRAGTDFISGGAGDDELTGGDGPDTITGNSGADELRGLGAMTSSTEPAPDRTSSRAVGGAVTRPAHRTAATSRPPAAKVRRSASATAGARASSSTRTRTAASLGRSRSACDARGRRISTACQSRCRVRSRFAVGWADSSAAGRSLRDRDAAVATTSGLRSVSS